MVKRHVPPSHIPETVALEGAFQASFILYQLPECILACSSLINPVLILLAGSRRIGVNACPVPDQSQDRVCRKTECGIIRSICLVGCFNEVQIELCLAEEHFEAVTCGDITGSQPYIAVKELFQVISGACALQ